MGHWLVAAGVYNLAWGGLTVLVPSWLFSLTGMEQPNYPFIWQCVGMIVGVYGIGYLVAAGDPVRHWPIVLVGFLGKIFGPLGYVIGVAQGNVPPAFGATLPTNDLIWWVPFAAILWHAFRENTDTGRASATPTLAEALRESTTQAGESLDSLSRREPLLLVALRHTGCVFCREAIADLTAALPRIGAAGLRPVVVHQGSDADIQPLLARHGIERIDRVADPHKRLYRALDLPRGSLRQLFGPVVWGPAVRAVRAGHGIGPLVGDGFQMHGAFVVRDGRLVAARRCQTAAERPDFAGLACGVAPLGDEPAPLPAEA